MAELEISNGKEGRAYVIKGQEISSPVSLKMAEDPFAGQYGDGILEPPYNLEYLAQLPDHSNILSQCVEAMETNIDGFGFMLEPIGETDPENDGKYTKEAEDEKKRLLHFFEFCNPDIPYSQLRRRVRRDLETLGNGYWEVVRDGKGEIAWIEHIEAHTMRLTKLDAQRTDVTLMIRDDESNEFQTYPYRKVFRRFVQIRNGRRVYFKEFGDPRIIDSRSGRTVGEEEVSGGDFIPATEVIHFKRYSPHSSYGVPRWIGNLLAVLGSRQAEEVNYEYFENNTVPPLALLVGGALAESTVNRIQDFINDNMKGRKGFHKILVVEASPATDPMPGLPAPKVSIQFQPLSDAQQKDALFDNYDKTNREKVRSSFRLPPIFVGLTSDYTRATAHESKSIAEEQVFAPERADHDFVVNRLLFPAMGIRYWKYKSLSPDTNDVEIMAGVIDVFSRCGLTVKEAREEMSRLLNRPLTLSEDEQTDWTELPLSVYLEKLRAGVSETESDFVLQDDKETDDKETEASVRKEFGAKGAALFLRSLAGIQKSLGEDIGNDTACPDLE
jgi:PBSX family phage portal protein